MRRLIVCADGTWNTPDQEDNGRPAPTNVVKLHACVSEKDADGVEQICYDHPGVGTEGGWFSRAAGGAYGKGLSRNIKSAYKWLADTYETGDEVFLFGFSRGAFTVRSLGGMISACGLLKTAELETPEAWTRVDTAFEEGYRNRETGWADGWERFEDGNAIPIRFVGVWDTVGALGVPNDLALLNILDDPEKWAFHDTKLGRNVVTARHALALDEMRASFTPTLWTEVPDDADVKQVWFPGVHCDVGGGYADCGLADGALRWMIDEAKGSGLSFDRGMVEQIEPNSKGIKHNSASGMFAKLRTQPRAVPPVQAGVPELHSFALERHVTPPITQAPYRRTRVLARGEPVDIPVYARERWNDPGLYLEEGTYAFRARGEWVDARIRCGPAGTNDGKFYVGEILQGLGSALGWLESGWKKASRNDEADFLGTKRVEDSDWFCLIGVVANGGNPGPDGTPEPHDTFEIGEGTNHVVTKGGYFHPFANDAWATYENNRGQVTLSISRIE